MLTEYGTNQGWTFINKRYVADVNGDGIADIVGVKSIGFMVSLGKVDPYTGVVTYPTTNSYNTSYSVPGNDYESGDHNVFVGDGNGDGLMDLFSIRRSGLWVCYSQMQNGVHSYSTWSMITPEINTLSEYGAWPSGYAGTALVLAELNGDGITDFVIPCTGTRSGSPNSSIEYVCLSKGAGVYGPLQIGGAWHDLINYGGLMAIPGDVNGDGLTDFAFVDYTGIFVELSKGVGMLDPVKKVLTTPNNLLRRKYASDQQTQVLLADLNSDGMSDVVAFTPEGVWTVMATGNGNFAQPVEATNLYRGYYSNYCETGYYCFRNVGDIDGNGSLDIVARVGNQLRANLSQQKKENVYNIKDGLGLETKVTYGNMSSLAYFRDFTATYPNKDLIIPAPLVYKVEQSNGLGGYHTITKEYWGFITNAVKGTSGFTKINTWDFDKSIFETLVYNAKDFHYKGFALQKEVKKISIPQYFLPTSSIPGSPLMLNTSYVPGQTISTTINVFDKKGIGTALSGYYVNADSRWFPYISSSTTRHYDINTGAEIYYDFTQTDYDDFGNITRNLYATKDGHSTENLYPSITNNTNQWLIGLVNQKKVTSRAPNTPDIVRITNYTYHTNLPLLRTEQRNPGITNFDLNTEFYYDSYGHLKEKKETGYTSTPTGFANETRVQTNIYTTNGRYLNYTENALGHRVYYDFSAAGTYLPCWGKPRTVTDVNGLVTTYEYDGLGRNTKITAPDQTQTIVSFSAPTVSNINGSSLPNAKYIETVTKAGFPTSVNVFDCLSRKIRSSSSGFASYPVNEDFAYDIQGRLKSKTLPYNSNSAPKLISYLYDVLDRTTDITTPLGNTHYTFNGLTETVTNALYQNNTHVYDNIGHVLSTKDNNNKTINFEYDAEGRVLKTIDINQQATVVTYDVNGNKKTFTEPNTGTTTTDYNAFGELYRLQNNAGQITLTKLDKLGRPTTTDISNTNFINYNSLVNYSDPLAHTDFTYDQGNKAIGKLTGILTKDRSNVSHYNEAHYFDNLGRESVSVYNSSSFTKSYDNYGRLSTVRYPYNYMSVLYAYNGNGYLANVFKVDPNGTQQNIYTISSQNAFNQPITEYYNTGVQVNYQYNNVGQTRFITASSIPGQNNLVFDEYNYNAIGNMTYHRNYNSYIEDTFGYDLLNRLRLTTSRYISNSTPSQPFSSVSLNYFDNGNISYKSDIGYYTYANNNARNNVVSTNGVAGSQYYAYDAYGNMTIASAMGIQSAQYNANNQIAILLKSTGELNYNYYTPYGSKIKEVVLTPNPGITTRFFTPDGLMEWTQHSINGFMGAKYFIKANGKIIGTYNLNSSMQGSMSYQFTNAQGSVVTDLAANGTITKYDYDTWGKPRNPNTGQVGSGIPTLSSFNLGYTGHRNHPDLNLVDMGGRYYSSLLGRFLSADPINSNPLNTQRHNRYSYVLNSPMSYTDPTGFDEDGGGVTQAGYDAFYSETNYVNNSFSNFSFDYQNTNGKFGIGIGSLPFNSNSNLLSISGMMTPEGIIMSEAKNWTINLRTGTVSYDYFDNNINQDVQVAEITASKKLCPECLDPSTILNNLWFIGSPFSYTYPGPNNPKNYAGKDVFVYEPRLRSEYPTIGHDRRYDRLGATGASGLFLDFRAIGADRKLIEEERELMFDKDIALRDKVGAFVVASGIAIASSFKTVGFCLWQMGQLKNCDNDIQKYYDQSNVGVTNGLDPSNRKGK